MPEEKYDGPFESQEEEDANYRRYTRLKEREKAEREEAERKAKEEEDKTKKKKSGGLAYIP